MCPHPAAMLYSMCVHIHIHVHVTPNNMPQQRTSTMHLNNAPQQCTSTTPHVTGPTQTHVQPHHTSGHPSDTPRSLTHPAWPHARALTTMDVPCPFLMCCGPLRHVLTGTFKKPFGTIYLALKYFQCVTFIVFKKNIITFYLKSMNLQVICDVQVHLIP